MIDCESFKTVVHEIDRPGNLEASALDAAWGHAQNCTRCARRLARARQLRTALCDLAREDEREQPPMRLEAELVCAFRAHRKVVRSSPRRKPVWQMAVAAMVAVMIGGGLVWHRTFERARLVARRTAPLSLTEVMTKPASAPLVTAAPQESGGVQLRHSSQASKVSAPPAADPVAELAEFLPLPFADDDSPLGTAEVVRIRLSESALGELGLPVSDEAVGQPVTADVVIGEDGVARAIRFISGPVPSEVVQQLQTMAFESKGANP
jgi:hypothetical protein